MQENVNHEVTVDVEVPTDNNVIAVENGVDMGAKYPTEYAWVPFFKELANTIRSYKDNHQGFGGKRNDGERDFHKSKRKAL